jgi:hypothetical protein
MAQPAFIQKTLRMKPEVSKLFDDLDAWLDYCRFNLIDFNPKDLYRSKEYKDFQREQEYQERKARRENRSNRQDAQYGQSFSN